MRSVVVESLTSVNLKSRIPKDRTEGSTVINEVKLIVKVEPIWLILPATTITKSFLDGSPHVSVVHVEEFNPLKVRGMPPMVNRNPSAGSQASIA